MDKHACRYVISGLSIVHIRLENRNSVLESIAGLKQKMRALTRIFIDEMMVFSLPVFEN